MKRQRSNISSGLTSKGLTEDGNYVLDPHKYPAILYALTDPVKRKKLEKITQSLKDFKQAENVCYGVNGPAFDVIGDLLDATK